VRVFTSAVLLAAIATVAVAQDAQRPVFRSKAAAVAVEANVRDRAGRPITGLAASDFEIYDNGVLQQVETISYGTLPIDVTVALDVSYSVTGSLLDRLQSGIVQLMRDLGTDDRLKLVLFNMRVNRVTEFTRDVKAVESALRNAGAGGGTALHDAISVALTSPSSPDRRQLLVFFTDGSDNSSTTTLGMLTAVGQRTRATLTFVMPRTSVPPLVISRSGPTGLPLTTSIQRTGPMPPHQAPLARLAAETGGRVLPVATGVDLGATFRSVLGEFRSTYVLYYTPKGVEGAGYHMIEVKVRRENANVQARRGYQG
jgi:VWFA-related protein